MKPILCTVGATHESGIVELLAPGRMLSVTALTDVAAGVPLATGRKVLVTLTGTRDEHGRELVASVRAVGPTEAQVRELVALNKQLAELSLPTPSRGEELNWLTKRYEQILATNEAPDDPRAARPRRRVAAVRPALPTHQLVVGPLARHRRDG